MEQKVKDLDSFESNSQEIERRITYSLLEGIFQKIDSMSYIQIILLPIMVVIVMWSQVEHPVLLGWGLLVLMSIYIRNWIAKSYFIRGISLNDAKKWGNRFSLASIFSALLWSSAIFLFYVPGSVEHQVFLFTLCVTLSISSIISGMYWLPSFYVFVLPVMGTIALRLIFEGTLGYTMLSIFILWFILFISSLATSLNKTMRSEMRLRYKSEELAEALHIKTKEAEQATQAKSKFLAAASHDLRQPLHALSLFVDVLKESESDKERASIFPRLELSVNALRKLFDSLLDVSKLDAKVVIPEHSHFDLAELLHEMVEEFKPAANEKKLKLKAHAQPLTVVSDRMLLERILRNLISNAIRYTNSGGILLSCRPRGNKALLQVWDTGIGIPKESKEEVFIEFKQLHNTHRDRTQGLGLGLSLVRRLCQLLNHPLKLDTKPGRGTVFNICIVRGAAALLPSKNSTPVARHSWDLSGRHVLVIDDEHEVLHAMKTILAKWGCDVITADSLTDAVDKLNRKNIVPELVLSDLRLRDEKTGIDAINSIREIFGDSISGILITGDTDPQQIKIATQSDYEVLQKPVRPAHLRTIIHHHLSVLAGS